MTDIQEQAPAAASADGAAAAPAGGARAKRASLSTMLLPELQQLASGMGISTTKLKKSDLVAAIKAAQAGGSAAKAATSAAQGRTSRPAKNAAAAPPSTAAEAPTQVANGTSRQRPPREPRTADSADSATAASHRHRLRRRPAGRRAGRQHRQNGSQQDGQRTRDNRQPDRQQDTPEQPEQPATTRTVRTTKPTRTTRPTRHQNRTRVARRTTTTTTAAAAAAAATATGAVATASAPGPTPAAVAATTSSRRSSDDDVLVPVAGILDAIEDKNTWFVRTEGYYASPDDVYVANSYVRKFNLRRGDAVTGAIRQLRDGERREKYNPLVRLDSVNGKNPDESRNRVEFTKLTPLYPQERLRLETEPHILTTRVIDLVMPIGKGQRALIVSPPKAGKTMVLQAIANAIATNNPEVPPHGRPRRRAS